MKTYLALDIGRARIGVAIANDVVRIATPLTTLANDTAFKDRLLALIAEHHINTVVVGWPRGLDGQETEQTQYVSDFVDKLDAWLHIPVHLQDEAATSVKAEAELNRRGKPYDKSDIDSLSAVYILEDYLTEGVN